MQFGLVETFVYVSTQKSQILILKSLLLIIISPLQGLLKLFNYNNYPSVAPLGLGSSASIKFICNVKEYFYSNDHFLIIRLIQKS